MCSDHFNLLLTVIPRYNVEPPCSSLDPQKKYVRWGGLCLFEMQMMLHFEVLNCICHSCCEISSLLRSSWRLSLSESSTTTPYKRVSSANSLTVEVRPFGRSLMYVRNNNGPRTGPCGTPEVTGEEGDVAPSQMTVWTLLLFIVFYGSSTCKNDVLRKNLSLGYTVNICLAFQKFQLHYSYKVCKKCEWFMNRTDRRPILWKLSYEGSLSAPFSLARQPSHELKYWYCLLQSL